MPFYKLPNLSAQLTSTCIPWEEPHNGYGPHTTNKEQYRAWALQPSTEHCFYSLVEGANPAVRISASNEARRYHGLVLDYDATVPFDEIPALLALNAPADRLPTWYSRTYSGGVRLVYLFEEPVPCFTPSVTEKFLFNAGREIRAGKLFAGWDMNVWGNAAQFYELGTQWTSLGAPLPANITRSWVAKAGRNHVTWRDGGTVIPIEVIREEAAARWPGRWPGGWDGFNLGSRGIRFWDDSATNLNGALVRETGMQFFTDGGGFKSWADIFGPDFVRHYQQDRFGGAIGGFNFDLSESHYWRKLSGHWSRVSRDDVILELRVKFGLSPKGNPTSEIDEALYAIQTQRAVQAVAPFVYRPDGVLEFNGKTWINTSTLRPIMPAPGSENHAWGQGFPWLALYFETLFNPADQLDFFISWLAHYYRSALARDPVRGLALFIAGPADAGKTFLNKAVLGQLLGARQEADSYLQGDDRYNDKLFAAPLWTIDDPTSRASERDRTMFSQMVKKVVANDSFTCRAMHKSGIELPWYGRVVVTMNDDQESLQALPAIDGNILDKIMLLKVQRPAVTSWPSNAEIAAELPFFAAFLRDYDYPERCRGGVRFFVQPYRHPEMLAEADGLSVTASFEEVLQVFRTEWFGENGPGQTDPHWEGNPTNLLSDLERIPTVATNVKTNFKSATHIGIHLAKILKKGYPWLTLLSHRRYRIGR